MGLPRLHLEGPPYEQGVRHGRELRDRVRHNLAVYFARFEREAGVPRGEVLTRAARYATAIAAQNGAYFAGMRGIADGAGCALDEIVALNVRYEIFYYQYGVNLLARTDGVTGGADGCTAFAVTPDASANGHLLIGENWDWIPEVQGAVSHTVEPGGLETLSFTEAGIFGGKIGLNSAGLGLAINGLVTDGDDWSRLSKPFHLRCFEILRSRDFDAATAVVTGADRACSTNFLIAQVPDRVVDIEAAPDRVCPLRPEGGRLAHTNHFLDPDALGVVEPSIEKNPHSYERLARMRQLLESGRRAGGQVGRITVEDLQGFLRDHRGWPYSICHHPDPAEPPEERYATVISAVMDLHARTLHLSDGPPCVNAYERFALE